MTTGDPLLDFAVSIRSEALTPIMKGISAAGSAPAYLVFVSLIYWVLSRRVGILLIGAGAVASAITVVAKDLLAWPRPPNAGETVWLSEPDTPNAFPSGHATASAVTTFGAAAHLGSVFALLLAAGATFAVSFSRLYLGLHSTADVVAGSMVGAGLAVAAVALRPRFESLWQSLSVAWRAAVGVLFALPVTVNQSPPALIICFAAAGAVVGHAMASTRAPPISTGDPRKLPALGAVRAGVGLPVLVFLGLVLGDPTETPAAIVAARFALVGFFVTYIGPLLFARVEAALPWGEGFHKRRPSH